ncbi:unnamed protein product [Danaus chrysippus]|uniref:(African queen) hypothetical protein n=1 Tax=Danaus chrysippus TaxID=151541 RepID=A0A8J2QKU3_9NEOP|nr:unnamed protein product [Danaus chrysippus]
MNYNAREKRSQPKVNRGNGGRVHFPKHRRTAASQTCAGRSETDDTTANETERDGACDTRSRAFPSAAEDSRMQAWEKAAGVSDPSSSY